MRRPAAPHWARGVRFRTALSATLVVALALAVASAALVVLQRRELVVGLTTVARQQGRDVAAQLTEGGLRAVDGSTLRAIRSERSVVQVVAPDGTVRAASPGASGAGPLSSQEPRPGQSLARVVDRLPVEEDDEPFVVVTTGVRVGSGVARVVTARNLEVVERSTTVLLTLLGLGYPLILLVVGGTSYWFAGRALAPVEAIRRRVGEVSAGGLDARVPVPPSGDEIARLATTMNQMLARLQSAAAAQRRFVADASHELRSPLTTIRATAELAATHPDAQDWPAAAASVLAETDRLDHLVGDLLLLARSDEHGLAMRVEDVDLDDIVTGEAARLRRLAGIDVGVDVRSVRVRGDAAHLARAVRNLVDNAARHARSSVRLRLAAEGGVALLQVVDDGPGIPPEQREHVFERFVRLDTSRERGSGGTGLGLAISRQIARAHAGEVTVAEGRDGEGARLVLTVPLPPDVDR